jgi:hypothetical protein
MQPFALTLARNGCVAITFDFPGHGSNAVPMTGALAGTGDVPGPYAVVGHSMASDIIVRHAQTHPAVQASVGVSLFAPSIAATTPPARHLVALGANRISTDFYLLRTESTTESKRDEIRQICGAPRTPWHTQNRPEPRVARGKSRSDKVTASPCHRKPGLDQLCGPRHMRAQKTHPRFLCE